MKSHGIHGLEFEHAIVGYILIAIALAVWVQGHPIIAWELCALVTIMYTYTLHSYDSAKAPSLLAKILCGCGATLALVAMALQMMYGISTYTTSVLVFFALLCFVPFAKEFLRTIIWYRE